jgi:hypothetical protein
LALHLDDYLSTHDTHYHDEEEGEGLLPTSIAVSGKRGVGYFGVSLLGYVVGLVMSIACSNIFHAAQPALLYLVPCVLGPIVTKAARAGHLKLLWGGWGEGAEGREMSVLYQGIEGGPQCGSTGNGNRPRWSLDGKKGGDGDENALHSFHHRKADVC